MGVADNMTASSRPANNMLAGTVRGCFFLFYDPLLDIPCFGREVHTDEEQLAGV